MNSIDFNRGYSDGKNSATMANPIHNNWKRDEAGELVHFNAEYLAGYKKGFIDGSLPQGYRPANATVRGE